MSNPHGTLQIRAQNYTRGRVDMEPKQVTIHLNLVLILALQFILSSFQNSIPQEAEQGGGRRAFAHKCPCIGRFDAQATSFTTEKMKRAMVPPHVHPVPAKSGTPARGLDGFLSSALLFPSTASLLFLPSSTSLCSHLRKPRPAPPNSTGAHPHMVSSPSFQSFLLQGLHTN